MPKWENITGELVNPDAVGGHYDWTVAPAKNDQSFWQFFFVFLIQLVLGWLVHMGYGATFVGKLVKRADVPTEWRKSMIGITRSTGALALAVMYAVTGLLVQIFNGDDSVTAFSIIALFLTAAIFRFIRLTHKKGNGLTMVPNLLVITALIFISMGYTKTLDGGKESKKAFYWLGGTILMAAGLVEGGLLMRDSDVAQTYSVMDDAAYVVSKVDYAVFVAGCGAFVFSELVLISQHEYRNYVWPSLFLYAVVAFYFFRILFFGITTPAKTTMSAWNCFIIFLLTLTILFGQMNLCSMFPLYKSQQMHMCHGLRYVGSQRTVRVWLFSIFAQMTLFFTWIGFMTSGMKADGSNTLLGLQNTPKGN